MSNTDSKSVLDVIKGLGRGEALDEAVKEAGLLEEEVIEEAEETKEAEEAEEVKEAEEAEEVAEVDPELAELAEKVAKIINTKTTEEALDKVATLVEKFNKEAEKLAVSQEAIITGLFNATCLESGSADTSDIIKMAEEENSTVPELVDSLYKYAETADAMLAEEYGVEADAYDENDVIKLATILIESTENPFGLEGIVEETKEAEEVTEEKSDVEALASAIVKQLKEAE